MALAVAPAQAPKTLFWGVLARDMRRSFVSTLAPADTFTFEVFVSDADGFQDVTRC